MKAGHTPGPWTVSEDDQHGQAVVSCPHTEIATCWHHCVGSLEKEMRANARLIAAAPDLLEALEEALGLRLVGTNNPNIRDDQILPVEVTMGELRKARAAIAKARGDA